MKKYKLKQWYPSLKQDWSKGDIAEWFDGYYWNKGKVILNGLSKNEVENNPDFWELIEEEKPLFTTYDAVQVTDGYMGMILVCRDLSKSFRYAKDYRVDTVEASTKIFAHESNADEYILMNKPVFSYNDIEKFQSGGEGVWYDIKAIAKERSEQ